MDRTEIQKLLKEKDKRDKLKRYDKSFSEFAQEQIKIITKDATKASSPSN